MQARRLVNFVAVVEQDAWARESWIDRGDVADALAARRWRTARPSWPALVRGEYPEAALRRDAEMAKGSTDW